MIIVMSLVNIHSSMPSIKLGTAITAVHHLGATRLGVWIIKHVVSPVDRFVYRLTSGRVASVRGSAESILLLTTTGRRSGKARTTPVFYLKTLDRLVICNVNPGFERTNPWVLNLRAKPLARVQIGSNTGTYHARVATEDEVAHYWPQVIRLWPAYHAHFERSGQRTIFILEPAEDAAANSTPINR